MAKQDGPERVKLKVITGRVVLGPEGDKSAFQTHEREVEREGAMMSVQPHIIVERGTMSKLAYEKIQKGITVVRMPNGLLAVRLNEPVTAEDTRRAIAEALIKIGVAPQTAYASQRNKKHRSLVHLGMLSETTKMGCYSFNLPAGPTEQGGTCPASAIGFMYLPLEVQAAKRRASRWAGAIDERKFLCNGCYALKNSYGNPSQVLGQCVKYEITRHWLARREFVPNMVRFIRAAQEHSVKRRAKLPRDKHWAVPHPNYFRIHDAGDFFTPQYVRDWFDICSALPEIAFWAPTRMWAMIGMASTEFQSGVPFNLALRPSSLHFREGPPPVRAPGSRTASIAGTMMPGLSAGSGSGTTPPAGAWSCPAMMHPSLGGGAKVTRTKKGKEQLSEGTCARAHGPNSPFYGGFDPEDDPNHGGGCRACWRNRGLQIYYHEH